MSASTTMADLAAAINTMVPTPPLTVATPTPVATEDPKTLKELAEAIKAHAESFDRLVFGLVNSLTGNEKHERLLNILAKECRFHEACLLQEIATTSVRQMHGLAHNIARMARSAGGAK